MQVPSIYTSPSSGKRQNAAPQVPRTRTGCWACRDRSVKCDETRPQCRKCEKLGLSCRYGMRLQWIEDSEARGVCHGREGVWSSKQTTQRKPPTRSQSLSPSTSITPKPARILHKADPISSTFFLNTCNGDIEHYYIVSRSPGTSSPKAPCPTVGSFLDSNTCEDQKDDSEYPCVAAQRGARRTRGQLEDLLGTTNETLDFYLPIPMILNPAGLPVHLNEQDEYILQFYVNVVCSTTTILDDEFHNPQRYVLIPMTTSSERVLAAVLAIGATKLAYNDARFRQRALFHRHKVLADLSRLLVDINTDSTRYLEALASTMILCWSDITDMCRSSWTHHLRGLSGVLESCPATASLDPHGARLIRTCQQYLVYHLIMAKATFCLNDVIPNSTSILSKYLGDNGSSYHPYDKNHAGTTYVSHSGDCSAETSQHLLPGAMSNMHYVDPHQGFSNALLVLINEICNLTNMSGRDENAVETAKQVRQLETRIEKLTQIPPSSGSLKHNDGYFAYGLFPGNTDLPQHRLDSIIATAEAHRLAALLFLDETCAIHLPEIVPSCRAAQSAHTEAILSLVESICEKEPVTAALPIWPVFIVGCATVTDEDRLRVLNILDQFQCRRIFGSIPPACAVIENVWRQRDLSSDENPRKSPPALSMFTTHNIRTSTSENIGKKRGRPRRLRKKHAAIEARYPWEPAMFMLGGSILSLT